MAIDLTGKWLVTTSFDADENEMRVHALEVLGQDNYFVFVQVHRDDALPYALPKRVISFEVVERMDIFNTREDLKNYIEAVGAVYDKQLNKPPQH